MNGESATASGAGARPTGVARAWAELLRVPALFTVPGDALAGAAAVAAAPNSRTLLAVGSSLCLYEAGMALNDWADRDEDAAERPHRPLPSGRVHPAAALSAACALTAAGLALAARAGRPALTVAAPLAATIWAYDLALKRTPAGPVAMAAARGLDLLLGAAAGTGRPRRALPSAALLATHTLAVTTVSRRETTGGSTLAPLTALATTALLTRRLARRATPTTGRSLGARGGRATAESARPARSGSLPVARPILLGRNRPGPPGAAVRAGSPGDPSALTLPGRAVAESTSPLQPSAQPQALLAGVPRIALGAAYAATAARPYLHAALNPSPPLTQRAVGGGIRAMIPLQAALAARAGAGATALLVAALAPLGRRFARTVSIT
ncbi:UbiA family prenyltransferase [Streptomyces gilvifuscus]|uniref:UbiA family prenyltransferase n=1 Tax=Streptomyces gilvifuscus TaxID=1550617 RepID=A0ABT5FZ32_9ACTN|nr:UbiA family prenyltransferase [Streptomyces gilvifuscus]MDC2957792.1 UbiA family prenyltransferase [Streptomyces gilvifuscus]